MLFCFHLGGGVGAGYKYLFVMCSVKVLLCEYTIS